MKRTIELLDDGIGMCLPGIVLTPHGTDLPPGCMVVFHQRQAGPQDTVRLLEVMFGGNSSMAFDLTKGGSIWKGCLGGIRVGWDSQARGPVHSAMGNRAEANGLAWLDTFDAGLVRCGTETLGAMDFKANGTLASGLHGRIGNIPVHYASVTIDTDAREIVVKFVVQEGRLFFGTRQLTTTYTMKFDEPKLKIVDVVENVSCQTVDFAMLYHIQSAKPFLQPGSQFHFAYDLMHPRDPKSAENFPQWNLMGAQAVQPEQVFFFEVAAGKDGQTLAVVEAPGKKSGFGIRWKPKQLQRATLWKNPLPDNGSFVAGVEPCTIYPGPTSFYKQQGMVDQFGPGDKRTIELVLEGYPSDDVVAAAVSQVNAIQATAKMDAQSQINPNWSAPENWTVPENKSKA